MMTQNLQDATKAFPRGKFIAIQSYLRTKETNKQPNLTPEETRERRTKKKNQMLVEGKKS